uniref:Uncharacterized protein n=1 Tax=Sphaerodactylus townsendi TaxID=933632 RepID=A0ACB8EE79_9SAUR
MNSCCRERRGEKSSLFAWLEEMGSWGPLQDDPNCAENGPACEAAEEQSPRGKAWKSVTKLRPPEEEKHFGDYFGIK